MAAVASHSAGRAGTAVQSSSEVRTDRIFARYLEWIQECKEAIHTLRLCIKQARAHREKCCSVLGAALGAALALEQAVYSGSLQTGRAQELQRLCASVTAAIELAQQRVQVYGGQSRIRKYASLARRAAIDAKFTQLIERLDELTKQAWTLQTRDAPSTQPDSRIRVNSRSEAAASSSQLARTGPLARSRLRRGCHCHTVQSLLYVGHTQGKNDSANSSGQVWWCLGSLTNSKMFAHDLATASTTELQSFSSSKAAVVSMQADSQGYVWMGCKGGMVQVWDADRRACLCQGMHMAPADVRVIAADSESSSVWVGTDTGRVGQLRLIAQKSDSGLSYTIDLVQTLQLAQPPGQNSEAIATSATLNPSNAQLPTPFSHGPRLTLSSSASSYRGPDGVTELIHGTLRRSSPSASGLPEGTIPEGVAPLSTPVSGQSDGQFSGQTNEQPSGQSFSSHPLLGASPIPLGPPPRRSPGRALSAELMHGKPQRRPGSPPSTPYPPSMLRSGSMSPAESPRQWQGPGHLPVTSLGQWQGSDQLPATAPGQHQGSGQVTGQGNRQSPMRRASSMRKTAAALISDSAAERDSLNGPVHAIAVHSGRVLTSSGAKAKTVLREWSIEGVLLMTHPCCSLGSVTCIAPVPDLVRCQSCIASSSSQSPSSTSLPSQKTSDAATWQLLTGHMTGHMKLWQASQQNPLQALAIIRAACSSPVMSLVTLPHLFLICTAHASGHITLHVISDQSEKQQILPFQQPDEGQHLPTIMLPFSGFEAHKSGLQQCVEGDTGLVSIGAFGSITVWPEAELRSTAHSTGLALPGRYTGTVSPPGVINPHQHMSQLLERFFTPRSARAVEKALGAMAQQVAEEEEVQGHALSPGLAALQRGGAISSRDAAGVLKEVVHLLTLSHADSNDLSLPPHPSSQGPLWGMATEGSPRASQGFAGGLPGGDPGVHQGIWTSPGHEAPAVGNMGYPQSHPQSQFQSRYQRRESSELARGPSTEPQHSQRLSHDLTISHAGGSVYPHRDSYDFAPAQSQELPLSQQQSRKMLQVMSQDRVSGQHASWRSIVYPHPDEEEHRLQRRVSFTDDVDFPAAAIETSKPESTQAELTHTGQEAVERAGPPPPSDPQVSHQQNPGLPHAAQLSAFYHSAHTPLARRGSSTSDNSASHYSPASSTHRGASQLLRLESRASDPFSNPVSSRQGSMTLPDAQFGAQLPSLAQARVRRDSVASQTSSECQHQSESSRHELDIVRLGSSGGSGGGGDQSWRGSGGPAILDRVSLSVLQGVDLAATAPAAMPRSQSHKNLRQGLERISAESQVEPDSSAPAVAAHSMRRTKSKLSLETLASVESMNCTIIEYSQLEIKRKIGDGSIGQVYLGKWQETDVAVKVLTEMQNLSSHEGVHPQDPSDMGSWRGGGPPPCQGGNKANHAAGLRVINGDSDSHGWGSDDGSSIGADSEVVPSEERQEALRTLEREVSIMAALRHPNVVMFMGLCLEPPCIVTEFCARGSLYDVLKKARGAPAFAQQLDWSRRLSMALDAAKGVLQLHSHKPPILHRDLKSPNMLVDRHWRVKVTDFNLSRMVKTGSNNASVTSLLANNPRWLAPEVVSKHDYSKAADVYSFGIILWEMMTWRLPWEELNPFQIMFVLTQQHNRPNIPAFDTLPGQPLPGIGDYIQLIQDCWHEEAAKRPRFEDIIISLRGLLESANNRHKLQKTLTAVPRLSTSCAVPPNMNKLAVVGQTPFGAPGTDPQQDPTPLEGKAKPGPLQVYETDRPFFGSTPVGGLDIMTSSEGGTGKTPTGKGLQKNPISGCQSQQEILQSTLKRKGRSPARRHTFGGTATNFGDQLDTAPSMFSVKSTIGGVHSQYNAGGSPELDPKGGKSMTVTAGSSRVPAWLVAKRAAAQAASNSPGSQLAGAEMPDHAVGRQDLSEGSAGKAQSSGQQPILTGADASQALSQPAPAVEAGSRSRSKSSGGVPEAGQSAGDKVFAKGSMYKLKCSSVETEGSLGGVMGSTPFSAFTLPSKTAPSRTSSDHSEFGQSGFGHPSIEDVRSGNSMTRRSSGPFGGRGVALGHMMAAQQQWRQDSFSKAQEQRRYSEESIRNGGENESVRATNRDQGDHKHHGRAEASNNAEGRRPGGGSTGDADDGDHFISWRPRQSQRCEALGKAGAAESEPSGSAGPKQSAGRPVQAETPDKTAAVVAAIAAAEPAPVKAYLNPFLTASQGWQPSEDADKSAEHSGQSDSSLPDSFRQHAHAPNPFAAAAAEQWLAARQASTDHTDDSFQQQARAPASTAQAARNAAAAAAAQHRFKMARQRSKELQNHGRQSPVGSPRGRQRREILRGKDAAGSQADHWDHDLHSPFELPPFQRRNASPKAGPPPDKGSYRNSYVESPHTGASSNSPDFSTAVGSGRSLSDRPSARSALRPPPSRRASFVTHNGQSRLDTIHSDSSAEASAQYSAKSSNASTSSVQLSTATAIVDSALKDSISGSGGNLNSGRLPSILLSKELDDVPFQTRLQTVIEGLEQSNSPSGFLKISADPSTRAAVSEAVAGSSQSDYSYASPFAAASPSQAPRGL